MIMQKGRGQNAQGGNRKKGALASDTHDMTNFLTGLSAAQNKRLPKSSLMDMAVRAEPVHHGRVIVSKELCAKELEKQRARIKGLIKDRTRTMGLGEKRKFTTKMLNRMLVVDTQYLEMLKKRGQGTGYTPLDVTEGVPVITEKIQRLQRLNEEIDSARDRIKAVKFLLKNIEEGEETKPIESLIALFGVMNPQGEPITKKDSGDGAKGTLSLFMKLRRGLTDNK